MQELRDISTKVWPSIQSMAADIQEDYDTVRKWMLRRRIPDRVWPTIIRKTARFSMPVTADMLLRLNRPKRKRTS